VSPAPERRTAMEPVVLACTDPSARGRSVVEWAAEEARLQGLPLRMVLGSPQDVSNANVIVCGVPRDPTAAGRPSCSRLPMDVAAAGRPLVLVPDEPTSRYRTGTILLGVDARRPSDRAIGFAFGSAKARKAGLHVVHAWSLPSCAAEWPFGVPETERATWEDHEVQLLTDALRPWHERYPEVPVLEDVLLLPPPQALLHHRESAALVVVGRGTDAGCGGVLRALLRDATCPVAVVPAGE
jgi:nucleotide-binding universal stress UspA family protein